MNIARLTYLRSWIRTHHDNGHAINQLAASELSEVNRYRKEMGPAPITLAQVLDSMIADAQKKENANA